MENKMNVFKLTYLNALNILKKIPVKLWGVSLMGGVLVIAAALLGVLPIITIPVIAALSAGMCAVYYKAYITDGSAECKTIFRPFKDFKTFKHVAGGMCWMYLWLFLWFIIPIAGPFLAVYKSLEYAFTPYILNEEPDVSAIDALKKSKEDTKGFKGQIFIAIILPIAGYYVLALLLSLLSAIPFAGVLFALIYLLVALIYWLIAPMFLGLVQAGFYEYGKKPAAKSYAPKAPQTPSAAPQTPPTPQPAPEPQAAPAPSVVVPEPAIPTACPVCGRENEPNKKFCGHCGAKLQ